MYGRQLAEVIYMVVPVQAHLRTHSEGLSGLSLKHTCHYKMIRGEGNTCQNTNNIMEFFKSETLPSLLAFTSNNFPTLHQQ